MTDTIFLINEGTTLSVDTLTFAEQLAIGAGHRLLVGSRAIPSRATAMVAGMTPVEADTLCYESVNISGMSAGQLALQIAAQSVSVVIKAYDRALKEHNQLQTLISRITVPVWLVPVGCQPIVPRHIAYITDLRYCRTDLLKSALRLTAPIATHISVVHLAAPGLPDLSPAFAKSMFEELCNTIAGAGRLSFQHIREPHLATIADVLINGLLVDGLVLANRSPHFNDLLPAISGLTTDGAALRPLLLFPG